MPRQPRLDAPGTLHHVMGRGIERTTIFRSDDDRADFVTRLAALCRDEHWSVYAWALMPNHFHLLVRTGRVPLGQSLQKLLTGYVVNFNRRHKRSGHLFQNRYKSIICEEDPYLREVTRYIHLNPVRGGLVEGMGALRRYPWTGHPALLGRGHRDWQDTATVLAHFGQRRTDAVKRYAEFVAAGVPAGRRPELVGGGLIRSLGGWAQVRSLRRKGSRVAADARILGSSDFVARLLADAAIREKETLRLARKVVDLPTVGRMISDRTRVPVAVLRSGIRRRDVVRARRLFCQIAVQGMGYTGAEVARFLGVTTSSVNRLAVSEELPEVRKYLNAL
jgi:REP-associated tyrosine transposase